MRDRLATILVIAAMLPQLVLGIGSGRVLEICFCGLFGNDAHAEVGHCHDHADGHAHAHHHHSRHSTSDEAAPCGDHQPPSGAGCECDEGPSPGTHSCDHLIVTGQFGRFEPAQSWNVFATLDALACVRVELVAIDDHPCWRIPPKDAKPPGDTLYTTRTTSFQI